jgi:hypothetical protein
MLLHPGMTTTTLGGLRFPGRGSRHARPGRDSLLNAVILVALVAVLATIVANVGNERRAIRALPDAQRLALYTSQLEYLRSFCGETRPDVLKDQCRTIAEFIVQFEECTGECEDLVRYNVAPRPTR